MALPSLVALACSPAAVSAYPSQEDRMHRQSVHFVPRRSGRLALGNGMDARTAKTFQNAGATESFGAKWTLSGCSGG